MKLIDVHAHLQFPQFDGDRSEVIRRAQEAGVGVINVGIDRETSESAVELADKHNEMWAAIGLHPTSAHGGPALGWDSWDDLKKLAAHSKVVAIGECGLDYYRSAKHEARNAKQEEIFERQIGLAAEVKKPLMLHIRNAYQEVLEILTSNLQSLNSDYPGNVHFFSGGWSTAKKFLDLGFTLSFSGVITFPPKAPARPSGGGQPRADVLDEAVKNTPLDMLLCETDCPFAAPRPWRGQRNEPFYVQEVLRQIAALRGLDEEAVRAAVLINAQRLFKL